MRTHLAEPASEGVTPGHDTIGRVPYQYYVCYVANYAVIFFRYWSSPVHCINYARDGVG